MEMWLLGKKNFFEISHVRPAEAIFARFERPQSRGVVPKIFQFWDHQPDGHKKWWKWGDFGDVLLSTFFRREAIFSFYYNNTCFNSALAHLGDLKMTFGTVFLHESVGKVQIYSGTLVWSQYDYFESRGIDFSEITVSNQVFRRSKFLKKHFFDPEG